MAKYAICEPSGETPLGTRMLFWVSSTTGVPARSVTGTNGIATGLIDPTRDRNASRNPSFESRGRLADAWTPVVTGSGSPTGLPVASSTGIRQRFIAVPRSLEKYTNLPSGDQIGDQSMARS